MERFYRTNPEESRASSMYSTDSVKRHAYSQYADSITSTSSQPIYFTPPPTSTIPPRKPIATKRLPPELKGVSTAIEPVELPTARSPPSIPLPVEVKGILVVAIAVTPHPSTVSFLETMLKCNSYLGISLIGNAEQEAKLKEVKMNIYALLGRLGLEVGVRLEFAKAWSETDIAGVVSRTVKDGELVNGVLCSPCYDGGRPVDSDILSLDERQLEGPWRCSVGFLHGFARLVVPKMRSNRDIRRANLPYFLVTEPKETSPISHFYETACENIVNQLAEMSGFSGVAVAYAQDILIPEPEPVVADTTNGKLHLSTQAGPLDPDIGDFSPEESPTKLYTMWALQDELGAIN